MRRALALALAVAFAAPPAAASAAETTWSNPSLPFGASATDAHLVPLPEGSIAALVGQADGYHPPVGPPLLFERPPGGEFGSRKEFGQPGDSAGIVLALGGQLAVAWSTPSTPNRNLSVRQPGSTEWTATPVRQPPDWGGWALDRDGNVPGLGYGANGETFGATDGSCHDACLVVRHPDDTYDPPHAVPESGPPYVPRRDLGVEPDGTTTLVWRRGSEDAPVLAATARPGEGFGPTTTVAASAPSRGPDLWLTQNHRGDLLAVWNTGPSGLFSEGALQASFRPAGGAWEPPEAIPGPDGVPGQLDVALNDDGAAAIAWPAGFSVAMSYRPAGGHFERATTFRGYEDPRIAIARNGAAVALWKYDIDRGHDRLAAADHPAGGHFGEPQVIPESAFAEGPDVALDSVGNSIAVWTRQPEDRRERPEGVLESTHVVGAEPPVQGLKVVRSGGRPTAFQYRLARPAKVTIRVRRKRGRHWRKAATIHASGHRGRNRTRLGRSARALARAGRYSAAIEAVDSARHRFTARELHFRVRSR